MACGGFPLSFDLMAGSSHWLRNDWNVFLGWMFSFINDLINEQTLSDPVATPLWQSPISGIFFLHVLH